MKPENRLLPEELYPSHAITDAHRDVYDAALTRLAQLVAVPTMPGDYGDKEGDLWTLDEEGSWTDKYGVAQPRSWHPLLPLFGPFRQLSLSEKVVKNHQRKRHLAQSRAAAEAEDRLFGSSAAASH